LKECKKRDVKGLYAKVAKGEIKNFTGISSPYEEPLNPEVTLNTEKETVERSAEKLEQYIMKEFSIAKSS